MKIIIKDYDNGDQEQVKELIDLTYEEENLLAILKNSTYKFAYSAFHENKLVGVVFGWVSNMHPYCTYFKIISNPLKRQSHVGEKLLAKVQHLKTIDFPLQTSICETSVNLREVYENNGFKEIRRTYMPTFHVAKFKDRVLQFSEKDYILKTLAEISLDNELVEKLVFLAKSNYEETHLSNPVVTKGFIKWKKLVFANDVILNGSYVCLDTNGKEILAYSMEKKY